MKFANKPRNEFIAYLKQYVHPSEEISLPAQLIGREGELKSLRDCFETNGSHAFVWGPRGVGKTSLVHTACTKFEDMVELAAAIGCQKNSTYDELLKDIYRRVINSGKVDIKEKSLKAKLSVFGLSIEGEAAGFREQLKIDSVNHASDFLNTILPPDYGNEKEWVIIIDEFDQLTNPNTIDFFTALSKQMSVDKVSIKFVFCGVASNLNDLIGSHESIDRYVRAVELKPLMLGNLLKIAKNICEEFEVSFTRGQAYRIGQIACGYPHFTHVIMNEILKECYDANVKTKPISTAIYKKGIQRAAKGAATRLQTSYDDATRRGTDRYIEVLWATADGQHLVKQFKNINEDYKRIMELRSERTPIENDQLLRNHLNELCKGDKPVLHRGKVGWYNFEDPMFRSYVRLIAQQNEVELGDESFKD